MTVMSQRRLILLLMQGLVVNLNKNMDDDSKLATFSNFQLRD